MHVIGTKSSLKQSNQIPRIRPMYLQVDQLYNQYRDGYNWEFIECSILSIASIKGLNMYVPM